MQPYFLPYIGYWQLLAAVDKFIVYDNIQYTKKGWINRNRFLRNASDALFTIPLKKDSNLQHICQRQIAPAYNREKLSKQLKSAYQKSPFFKSAFPLLEKIIHCQSNNLFDYIYYSIIEVCDYLDINSSKLVVSSKITADHTLRSEQRVIAICKALHASEYYNPIGGTALYSKEQFEKNGIELHFLQPNSIAYQQFTPAFTPWLSIVDVLMFNHVDDVKKLLGEYILK